MDKVKLIAMTQSYIDGIKTPEELITYCARVSNPTNQLNINTAPKLLAYCIKNNHWSIFEQVTMTIEIKTSRAIAQQILRHRSFSFQEFSQRYSKVLDFETIEFREQGQTNRQAGTKQIQLTYDLDMDIHSVLNNSKRVYNKLIEHGVAKECARFILPLCTQTTLYMTGNIRSWIHYFQVRCSEHTQKEHQIIANQIKENIFKKYFPIIYKEINNHTTI